MSRIAVISLSIKDRRYKWGLIMLLFWQFPVLGVLWQHLIPAICPFRAFYFSFGLARTWPWRQNPAHGTISGQSEAVTRWAPVSALVQSLKVRYNFKSFLKGPWHREVARGKFQRILPRRLYETLETHHKTGYVWCRTTSYYRGKWHDSLLRHQRFCHQLKV